jgi:hypothetical protein
MMKRRGTLKLHPNKVVKNWDGAESKTRPSNLTDTNLNQSELTRDTEYTGLPDVAIYRQSGDKIVYYGPRE